MTAAERRERNRLRSERWRRVHGIGPRRPAQRPWLALPTPPSLAPARNRQLGIRWARTPPRLCSKVPIPNRA